VITARDVVAARRRIAPFLAPTPLRRSEWLSRLAGGHVYLKLESVQPTNAFKIRGAYNAGLQILERARRAGTEPPEIVTASAGNHGRAMALVSERLGLRTTVFTPRSAPETKKTAIRQHGVHLNDESPDYDGAERAAKQLAAERGAEYVSPYNHPDVIAGAGTTALEILAALPALNALVVPVGGGGLASGMGLMMKAAASRSRVICAEAAASTPFAVSLQAGAITRINAGVSLADGLTGNLEPGAITFDLVRQYVDQLVSVTEDEIVDALRGLIAEEHLVTEGAGAVAAAALIRKAVTRPGETVVVVITGANIDCSLLADLLRARNGESE
jgi:threonine dehydratase